MNWQIGLEVAPAITLRILSGEIAPWRIQDSHPFEGVPSLCGCCAAKQFNGVLFFTTLAPSFGNPEKIRREEWKMDECEKRRALGLGFGEEKKEG